MQSWQSRCAMQIKDFAAMLRFIVGEYLQLMVVLIMIGLIWYLMGGSHHV